MTKLVFIFIDGIGLGREDPAVNPFVRASMPNIDLLLGGNKIVERGSSTYSGDGEILINTCHASLLAVDACLGVDGLPQSASGQASLLTGRNIPAMLGYHYGPKPNPEIIEILKHNTLFSRMIQQGQKPALLNAYPPRYFATIDNGYRLPGAIALAARLAGIPLKTQDDLFNGEAISTDFTAQGWHDHLGIKDTPLLEPTQAGIRLFTLSKALDLAFFEYWLTDIVGHHQDMDEACDLLELFDAVIGQLVNSWGDDNGLILLTSDHGNMEDLSTRRHTRNDVPLLLIGTQSDRDRFIQYLQDSRGPREKLDLTDITPAILNLYKQAK